MTAGADSGSPLLTWCVGAALLATIALGAPTTARADEGTLRALVLASSEEHGALLARIEGQVSDLPVETLRGAPVDAAGPFGTQLGEALARARGAGASVAIWFEGAGLEEDPPTLILFVALVAEDRVLVRRLGNEDGGGSVTARRSALLEEASLLVRQALETLARGGTIGISPAEVRSTADAAEADATGAPSDRPAHAPRPPGALPRLAPALGGWAELGPFILLDGESDVAVTGISLEGGLRGRPLGLPLDVGLHLDLSLPAALEDDLTAVTLVRIAAGVTAAFEAPLGRSVALRPAVSAGLLAFHRSTAALAPTVSARPPEWSVLPWLGAQVGLRVRVGSGLFLVPAFGIDVLPVVPRFEYEAAEGVGTPGPRELWPVQPRLEVRIGGGFAG